MNLLTISKEIKKINNTIDIMQNQNHEYNENFNDKLLIITNEIKNDINNIYNKIDQLYDFKINNKINDTDEIYIFLKNLNIDTIYINKIIFLNCNSLNELLLLEDEILEKLDIPINIINIIKNKIQEKLYMSNIEF